MSIRSIHKNVDVFKTFLNSLPKSPDVVALNKAWLRESSKYLWSLDGAHSIVRADREHGGITVLLKTAISLNQ